MATTLPHQFNEFLKLLEAHHVEYLLLGGYAASYHGYPRATAEVDVWVRASNANAKRATVRNKYLADLDHLPGRILTPTQKSTK